MSKDDGILTSIEVGWYKTFALFPCRTITKKWIWLKPIYARVAWRYSGMCDEPYTEYATLLEILADDEKIGEDL